MNYYVEVPFEALDDLIFPQLCPFTLQTNPDMTWEIEGHTDSDGISLPGVTVMVTKGRKCLFRIPVSRKFGRLQHQLALASAILIFPFFALLVFDSFLHWFDAAPVIISLVPIFGVVLYLLRRFLRRHVWIDFVGTESLEVVFKRKQYVEEFCDLNDLEFKRKLVNFRSG